MDGMQMMEWSERMWGFTTPANRSRIQGVVIEMGDEEVVSKALGGIEFSRLILGMALIGLAHCQAQVPRGIPEPSMC